ncbi:MAG: hypothetical protein IRZ07_03920 [Microbispora sp.]|nr:hypothetical protein [Microbispora sp.]
MKLLEQVPLWKRLKELPGRVEALERRIAALEAARPAADACPKCHAPALRLLAETPDPMFGDLGVKLRAFRCEACGFETSRQISGGDL